MDGIIIINKEKNYTSHDIVSIVKKEVGQKVGHTGTLDPNATGVLPLLIGKATLISKYLIEHDKTYLATLKLGEKRTTADEEGQIVEKREVEPMDSKVVEVVFEKMVGKQIQTPPIYSAIKVKGKKLYEYARKGQEEVVEIPKREIEIKEIEVKEINWEKKEIVFEVSCSKGTYIRSLCEDIAEKLGTVGYMKELLRTRVGRFQIERSVRIEEIKENPNLLQENMITIEELFCKKEKIELSDKEVTLFLNGVKLQKQRQDGVYRIYEGKGKFLGLGVIQEGRLKRDVIL